MGTASGFLALISAAVTPVVMISVCATLIIGIGSKHAGLADQSRALAAQYRATPSDSRRRLTLHRELRTFLWRATLAWVAHCLLYLSATIFAATVPTVLFAQRRTSLGRLTLILFVLGTATLILALVCEFLELLLAQRTLLWEIEDVLADDPGSASGPPSA